MIMGVIVMDEKNIIKNFSFNEFIDTYKELIWVILMISLCILDAIVMAIDFNIWSLIGCICCGVSAVLNLISFVQSYNYRKKFKE